MKRRTLCSVVALATVMLCTGNALAEKPSRPSGPPPGPNYGGPPGPTYSRPPGPPPRGYRTYGRYYPPHGHVVPALPPGYHVARHYHDPYYYYGGVWYRPYGGYYRVIAPPFGLTVSFLPDFYTTVWFGGVPYYYANSVYYARRIDGPGYVITEPPRDAAEGSEPAAAVTSEEFFAYPRMGQNEEAQARDRYECHQWAVTQTGFDPSRAGGGVSESENGTGRSEYRRAITACLEARGYTVR